ncbi:uncharacterized protein N7484_007888 [Penicillium longicatenatum]|uniref:uncharacterized protein n=1 Tax=Penicillium longicatenatum TaxID=1561947 RepID=UPI002548BD44|nr:uncharacterized protein N7484_007888 [Penicillium longicatenatum]KAJ5640026.1 hypothetical protein N7484_007888 [Penicillium longicatenatum]
MSTVLEFIGTLPTYSAIRLCKVTEEARLPPFDGLSGYERYKCTVIDSIKPWQNCKASAKITFHVVLDSNTDPFQGVLPSFVNIIKVPQSFQPKLAKYKGRALEWCRQHWELSESDWILHLDEETQIDDYLINACLDFIERGTEDFGMGTIYYTTHNYWESSFLTTDEVSRVAEDFGRFQLPVRLFRQPLFGCIHGSFLLINGLVENEIT